MSIPSRKHSISFIRALLSDSRAVGILLILCTVLSLVLSNSSWAGSYVSFWEESLPLRLYPLHLPHSSLHFINDALMAVFFLLAGLEIKRELLSGELASIKKSMLPVMGAIGGMVVPAVIYIVFCGHTPFRNGWGIPIATDIAFSLGVLSLLGKRAPVSLRIFLTALAIIDDVGGIITIALFYAGQMHWLYMGLAALTTLLLIVLNRLKVTKTIIYLALGLLLWYFVFNSGLHATIAGVILAFTIPSCCIDRLEHRLHIPVNFFILPLFALANTAIIFPADMHSVFGSTLYYGIFVGLLLGKPLGILLFSALAVKMRIAALPQHTNWTQLAGIGCIAGIGFTVSIFIATLAITDLPMQAVAKIGVITASALAGIIGFVILKSKGRKQ